MFVGSVTQRINEVKQPRGGYVKPSQFTVRVLDDQDNKVLHEQENISPATVGMVVDYMTRCVMGASPEKAFEISLLGAQVADRLAAAGSYADAQYFLSRIRGLDDESVICACHLVSYDVWYRNTSYAMQFWSKSLYTPDKDTIDNICTMVSRSIDFWDEYGPITKSGFTFEHDGYTKTVSTGDGDFLTKDTLWDYKVSKSKITNKHTLQLLMYWIMGRHSGKEEFKSIENIGVYNPRLNTVYLLPVSEISPDVIRAVERDAICY